MLIYIFIFFISCGLLFGVGGSLIDSIMRIARFLEWKEFVIAFFMMAVVGALPNLFVGISSALYGIPQLSFGDVVGGNVVDLTIAVAIAAFIAKGGLPAKSQMVQTTSLFTIAIAILPLLLIIDGILGRGDGIILILVFFLYILWLFSKKKRFIKVYDINKDSVVKSFRVFVRDLWKIILGLAFLLLAAEGIVVSSRFFAEKLGTPAALVGILIIGLGNALPEIYFAVVSARNNRNWIVLGDLMSSIITPSTLVLGIVALINPIKIFNFSAFFVAGSFLVVSALFFFFFIWTDRKITKKEALYLLGIYVAFVIIEMFQI